MFCHTGIENLRWNQMSLFGDIVLVGPDGSYFFRSSSKQKKKGSRCWML